MEIISPAKINLFLQVTGKRPDGYHNLITLMCRIGLCDTVSMTFGVKNTSVSCNHPDVPDDETNLAFIASKLFFNALNLDDGVEIYIDKNIPVAAGLGGGSSNAATVLAGLNRFYGAPFSMEKLISMGGLIGADVPFFLFKKPAIATGIGEKLNVYNGLKNYKILLVYPEFKISTSQVYKKLNLGLTNCKKKLRYSFSKYRDFDAKQHLCNDLETVAELEYPEVLIIKETLVRHGASGALMTGSGPTVFGLFPDDDTADNAMRMLEKNVNWRICLTDLLVE